MHELFSNQLNRSVAYDDNDSEDTGEYQDDQEQLSDDNTQHGDSDYDIIDQDDQRPAGEVINSSFDTVEEVRSALAHGKQDFLRVNLQARIEKLIKDSMKDFKFTYIPTRSIFRRRNYQFLKSEPKKVYFQILVQHGQDIDRTPVFETNIESQSCQKIFIDDQKEFYVICQTQQADGKKFLIVKSPMQICNNLHIPLELVLSNRCVKAHDASQPDPNIGFYHSSLVEENDRDAEPDNEYYLHDHSLNYEMLIKPDQSVVIPLRACGFNQVQLRPLNKLKSHQQASALNRDNSKWQSTEKAPISLLNDEQEIFEQAPIMLESRVLRKNIQTERNNKIHMVLNSNIYSIRSYVDFNTQQTEFISMRYLSISPPFVFQNLVPAPITLFFKNIVRKKQQRSLAKFRGSNQIKDNQEEFEDPQLYDLDLKHNSQQQILFLDPLGNFDMSMVIPGYERSNFLAFKDKDDEDQIVCDVIKYQNKMQAQAHLRKQENDEEQKDQENVQEKKLEYIDNTIYRFIKQKERLFQLVSEFQNQFNICASIAFIQGQYHLTFYSKYWLLNNTLMPLEVQISTKDYQFERMNLPYENQDFDFDTIKKFSDEGAAADNDANKKDGGKPKRKRSNDTLITQTVADDQTLKGYGGPQSIISNSKQEELDDQVDYRQLVNSQRLQLSEKMQFGRIKPWEGYKFQTQEDQGLLGLLTQQDLDSVQVVYFTQEEYKDEAKSETDNQNKESNEGMSQSTSQRGSRIIQTIKRGHANINNADQQSMLSKTSIQIMKYQEILDSQQALPLIHTELSDIELYPAPLQDKNQLKRIILFSDNQQNLNDQNKVYGQQQFQSKETFIKNVQKSLQDEIKFISLKICDSDWTDLPFDVTKLQGESIHLKDRSRKYCTNSMYEIVANVQYLPNPFSFSKIIEFKPRYMMVNKTHMTIQIIQAECEENGMFKVYPFETSNFHWTDSSKPQEINVKFQEHEYSGNIRIDGIGEINLRLRGTYENDSIILSVSISEERNSLFIIFNDVSYAPPYRIENLTRTTFKVFQVGSRTNDFDILKPFQIIPYAWSYPLNEKLLEIYIGSSCNDEKLGSYKIDQINKSEQNILKCKKSGRQFLLEILNEQTLKIIRISYTDEHITSEIQNDLNENQITDNFKYSKLKIIIKQLGISIINSQARELAYQFMSNFKLSVDKQMNNRKFSLKIADFQIDDQLVRESDAIILRKDLDIDPQHSRQNKDYFLCLKVQYMKNDAIKNLYLFKYFYLMIAPFNLNLNGNFIDEMMRYGSDIIQQSRKYQAQDRNQQLQFYDKDANDVDQIKKAFNEFKKPYDQPGREIQAQKKIYVEEFYIHDIKMRFTFKSSPIMFRELSMNPTLKFLILLMSNLKKVELNFSSLQIQQQQQLMNIFFAQIKRHYLQQCYNHQQILKLISSMGLFGNISESLNNLTNALESLVYHPLHEDNLLKGIAIGGAIFLKQSIKAVVGPIKSVFESLKGATTYVVQYSKGNAGQQIEDEQELSKQEQNMFDNDIEQVQKDISNFGTPLNALDTQNRIWLLIILKERQSRNKKREFIQQHQREEANMRSADPGDNPEPQVVNNQQNNQNQEQQPQNIEDQDIEQQRQVQNLQHFYQRQNQNQPGRISQFSSFTWHAFTYVPRKLIYSSSQMIDNMNTRLQYNYIQKIRPPRFTSFTMQIEPYSLKKAFALQILNDININVLQTETIKKLYAMDKYVIIFTAKRLICVEEIIQKEGQSGGRFSSAQINRGERQVDSQYSNQASSLGVDIDGSQSHNFTFIKIGNSKYKHWNVFFNDIMKLRLEMMQYDGLDSSTGEQKYRKLTKEEQNEFQQSQLNRSMHSHRRQLRIASQYVVFNLKILYTQTEEPAQMTQAQKLNGMNKSGAQMPTGGLFADEGLLMSDFRIGSKDIRVYLKDIKSLKKVYKQVFRRSNQDLM